MNRIIREHTFGALYNHLERAILDHYILGSPEDGHSVTHLEVVVQRVRERQTEKNTSNVGGTIIDLEHSV